MVGPVPEEERRRGARRVGAGFAAVVGVSAGLMALHSGATPAETGAVTLVGLLFGAVLLVVLADRW